jgi:hypothetical protein
MMPSEEGESRAVVKVVRRGRERATREKSLRATLALCATLSFSGVAAADPTAEQREESREHFRAGNEAFARGDDEAALSEYQQAYVLARSFDIACNLGRVEYKLSLWPHAAEHLDECLANFSASTRADLRNADQKLSELFDEVRGKVGLLRIDVLPERGSVTVGARSVLGPWPAKVFVLPGEQVVSASLPGYASDTLRLVLSAGEDKVIHFALSAEKKPEPVVMKKTPGPPVVATPADAPPPPSLASLKLPVIVAGGVLTAAGIGMGVFFSVRQSDLRDQALATRRTISGGADQPSACNGAASAAQCDSLAGTVNDGRTAGQLATAGFVAGGVFALGTAAAWWLWPHAPRDSALHIMPAVGLAQSGGPVGAELTGRFSW